jgi:hypothetical protein
MLDRPELAEVQILEAALEVASFLPALEDILVP